MWFDIWKIFQWLRCHGNSNSDDFKSKFKIVRKLRHVSSIHVVNTRSLTNDCIYIIRLRRVNLFIVSVILFDTILPEILMFSRFKNPLTILSGGMSGRSIARVIQLRAIKKRIEWSNHWWDNNSWHLRLALEHEYNINWVYLFFFVTIFIYLYINIVLIIKLYHKNECTYI